MFKWLTGSDNAPEKKHSMVGSMLAYFGLSQPVWTERDFAKLAREGFMKNPVVFACASRTARAVAAIPVNLYDQNGKEIERHAILDLINRPNSEQTRSKFVEAAVCSLRLGGNSYIEKVGIRMPRELHVLRTDRTKPVTGPKGWPSAYEYEVAGRKKQFPVRGADLLNCDVIHMRDFHPLDDWTGMGPVDPAARAIDVHNQSTIWVKSLLDNSARPSGAFVYSGNEEAGGTMGTEQFDRLKDEITENYSGAGNAGRPMLLEGGLDWRAMGATPQEMDFLETRREMAREICIAWDVPPMVLGIPGDNTYSNYQEANAAFHRQLVIPLAMEFYARLSQWLSLAIGEDIELKPDLDEIPALAEERKAVWEKVSSVDFLSDEEKREALGYSRKPAVGDTVRGLTPRPVEPPKTVESRDDPVEP